MKDKGPTSGPRVPAWITPRPPTPSPQPPTPPQYGGSEESRDRRAAEAATSQAAEPVTNPRTGQTGTTPRINWLDELRQWWERNTTPGSAVSNPRIGRQEITPAWIGNRNQGSVNNMGMPYNRTPPMPAVGGTYYNPIQGAGSFLGGGGWLARGPNGAVSIAPPGVGTFIGAGGQAVRGPNNLPLYTNTQGGGGGGGWGRGRGGGGWGRGRGGGGWDYGGGYGGYTQREYDPQMGLFSWNFKG